MINSPSRGALVSQEITALLKARNTLLWVTSGEESRVRDALVDAASAATYEVRTWDCDRGFCDAAGKVIEPCPDPSQALAYIASQRARALYVLLDFHAWLRDPYVLRRVKNLARSLEGEPKASMRSLAILSYSSDVPPELAGVATAVDFPLPDKVEIGRALDDIVSVRPEMAPQNGERDAAIRAAVGLTLKGAENCFAKSLVSAKGIVPSVVASEKRRLVSGVPGLEWYDPDPRGLDAIGGLDLLKAQFSRIRASYSEKARAYGIQPPKGSLLLGPAGTGKSLSAKCVATVLGVPLLRVDMNAAKGKFVGDSEKGIRRVFQIIDATGESVVWFDEIEKQLGGASGPQGSDGGVSADQLGTFLAWMQEKKSGAYVLATSNDVRQLPPELLRKGRFDDVWWVDLPNARERAEVVRASLAKYGRDVETIDVRAVADACAEFVGAEIDAIVPEAMLAAFTDDARSVTTQDPLIAAGNVVPLSKTAAEKIADLRTWAKGRARPASTTEGSENSNRRALDL